MTSEGNTYKTATVETQLSLRCNPVQHERRRLVRHMDNPCQGGETEGFTDADRIILRAGKSHVAVYRDGFLIPEILQVF